MTPDLKGAGSSTGRLMPSSNDSPQPHEIDYPMRPIGVVRSCYKMKLGIPRQPGLSTASKGSIELLPPFNQFQTLRGLEGFSHVLVIFVFSETIRDKWFPLVRPPRLGGNQKVGVFATRSTFRPNPIGLSVVKLEAIRHPGKGKIFIDLSGLDMLDGTPVLDIKPYLPYADCKPEAFGGFAPQAPEEMFSVRFTDQAELQLQRHSVKVPELRQVITESLRSDPRPAYRKNNKDERLYHFRLYHVTVVSRVSPNDNRVFEVLSLDETSKLNPVEKPDQRAKSGYRDGKEYRVGPGSRLAPSTSTSVSSASPSSTVSASKPLSSRAARRKANRELKRSAEKSQRRFHNGQPINQTATEQSVEDHSLCTNGGRFANSTGLRALLAVSIFGAGIALGRVWKNKV